MTSFTEPFAVIDTFVTGIGRVEELSKDLFRVTLCVDGKAAHDGTPERAVISKLIMTADTMAAIAQQFAVGAGWERLVGQHRDLGVN